MRSRSESDPAPRAGSAAGDGAGGATTAGGAGGATTAGGATGFSWTEAAPRPVARFEANGVVVDGELWVMGGFLSSSLDVTKRVDIYDPSTDRWRLGPELPDAETHLGVANIGGDILLVGGFKGNVLTRTTTAGVWRWSAADATWTACPDLPTPRAAAAAALIGSQMHLAGGLAQDGTRTPANTSSGISRVQAPGPARRHC